jgi:hypothetical protein
VKTKWGAVGGIQGAWGDWFGNNLLGSYSATWLSIFCATQENSIPIVFMGAGV